MLNLDELLNGVKTAAIAGHVRPDGDCVGSCMGLYLYIKEYYQDVDVDIYLEEFQDCFRFITRIDDVKHTYKEGMQYDLLFILDSGDPDRIGVVKDYAAAAAKTVCIDHHISNKGYGDMNYIEPEMSSASEMIFGILDEEKITREIAEPIYTGMVHDTGVFQYSSTTEKTMNIAGKLMAKGIPFSKIVDQTFYEKTYVQNQILGRALLESVIFLDGKCIMSAVTKKEMDFYGVDPKDLDGIVSQLRITKGVEVALFLYEVNPCEFKVSMRSNGNVDLSKIAALFGGGGHKAAAGCNFSGTAYDAVNSLSYYIEKQLNSETGE